MCLTVFVSGVNGGIPTEIKGLINLEKGFKLGFKPKSGWCKWPLDGILPNLGVFPGICYMCN